MVKFYKHIFFASFLSFAVLESSAQWKDLPGPPTNLQTVPIGSLVIPMDNAHQNLTAPQPFNLKAYGLVNKLLQNDIPVYWVIKAGKSKDDIDFSATVQRIYPTFIGASLQDFRASAFIIDSAWVNKSFYGGGQTATQVITAFGGKVAVYKLMANTIVDVRYTLNQRPKLAIFDNGGNQAIHTRILDTAKFTNYVAINAGVFPGLAECYTFCSEAHWGSNGPTGSDTAIVRRVWDFVYEGGNFFAQCLGVATYENNMQAPRHFHTTNGITIINASVANAYYNPDLAYMQFEGSVVSNQGGSEKNWVRNGGAWASGFYYSISNGKKNDTVIAAGAHLAPPDSIGGNVFYMGGHNYFANAAAWSDINQINEGRMYLNAALIPARRPTTFVVTTSPNTTICQGQQTTLSASGPAGTTYNWSPASSLSNPNISNPIASPTVTTAYLVITMNGSCPGTPATVTVTVNGAPAAPTATSNSQICTGSTLNLFANTIAGATYSWSGPNSFSSTSQNPTIGSATSLNAGTYSVIVTVGGCTGSAGTTLVIVNPVPTATASQTNVSCFGGSNGTATATVSNGTPAYTYSWSNGQTTSTATGLITGNYSVTITDSKGCTTTTSVSITEPTVLTATVSSTNVLCNGGNSGTAMVSASGGTPSYTYFWSNGQTTSSATGLIAGNYTVTTTDSQGCTKTATVSITQPAAPLSSASSQTNVSCFGGSNGTASVSASGGTISYTYLWSNGQTTSAVTGLSAGTYSITITDSEGCATVAFLTITQPALLTYTVSQTSTCASASNGSASVSPSGGTPAYTYFWSTGATTSSVTGLAAGNYSVTITDANGCTTTAAITITLMPNLFLSQNNVSCFGGNNGTAIVSATNGISPYTYSWSSGQTTSSVSGLTAGNYSVTVTDNSGCVGTATITITQPVAPLSSTASTSNVSCNGGGNGTATVSTSGGTLSYTYLWSNGQTTSSATNLSAGNYSVTITDSEGCMTTATVSIVQPAAPLSSAASTTNVSCGGGSDGTATVSPSGGTPSYSYLWSNGQTTSTATALTVGNYSVTITDANGCTTTASVAVTEPTVLSATVTQTNVSCFGGSDGTASISPFGGTPPYTFQWSNGQTTSSVTGLSAGTYTAVASDANGCAISGFTITQPPAALTSPVSQTNVSCFGGSNGTATAAAAGGTPSYTYLWNNGQTTSSATNLSAGNYSVTITDANGCTTSATVSIAQPLAPLSSTSSPTNVSCNGGSDGSASVSPSGGTPSYSYLWNNGQTTSSATNLSAGNYSVTTTDANGCTATATVSIAQPAAPLSSVASPTNVSCNGGSNGSASVSASGGTPSYSYLWSNGQTTSTATGLIAGNYSVTTTDANGCTTTNTVSITQPAVPLSSSSSPTNVSCTGGSNGSASVSASGGTPSYSYLWGNGQTTSTATGLIAGNYSVTTTDANGCTTTASVSVSQPAAALASTFWQTDASCFGDSTGTATVSPSGGTPSYTYLWSSGQTTAAVMGVPAGNYTATITDANGCTSSQVITITEPAVLTSSVSPTNVSCNGGSDGTAAATAAGGTPFYFYSWNTSPVQNTQTATGLIAGNYSVTITDVNGCSSTSTVSITQPAAPLSSSSSQNNISCFGGSNGSAIISVSGGTTAYTYSWSNGQTTSSATGLIAGNYSVTITDANGCTTTAAFTITQPAAPLSSTSSQTNVSCFGGSNGSTTVSVSGGTISYTYLWNNGQTTSSATNLSVGNYSVTITDANGCTTTATFSITQPVAPLSSSASQNNVSCNGGNNGAATVSSSGGTPSYSYLWSNGQTTSSATNLSAGNYSVTITDANGCTTTNTFLITEPTVLTSASSQTNVSCNGGSNGTASVTAGGGTPSYIYLWSSGQTTASVTGLPAGNYSATITDANGCTATSTFSITQPAILIATASQTNVSCNGGSNGTATAMPAGGTSPYTYYWSNGQTTSTATGLSAGNYTVTVTDMNGCTISGAVSITQPFILTAAASQTNVSCNGGSNGSASVTPSGGTPVYSYLWSNGNTTSQVTNLTSQIYTVTITDTNGCATTSTVSITQPTVLTSTSSQNNVSCFGGNNGTAAVSASGGTPSYTYLWNNGQTTLFATGLIAGNYSVTITDANGCTTTNTFSITQPAAPLSSSSSQNNVSCNGGGNGSATVSASGGTPSYTYSWSNGQTTSTATGLIAGNYSVTVMDMNGCTTTSTFSITQPVAPLSSTSSQTNVSCNGGSNGTAAISVSGGTTAYTYLWNNGQTTSSATNLSAGNYSVTITDANGCTTTNTFSVTEPAILTSTTSQTNACSGSSSGLANIFASGGTPAYSYSWSNGQTTSSATGLSAGNYSVTITDANGCTLTTSVTIMVFPALFSTASQTNVSCFGGSNGSAADSAFGGTAPFTYLWSSGQTTTTISGLIAGNYIATITDANGCTVADTVTITEPLVLAASTSVTASGCSFCTGSSTANASGGTSPYTYLWNPTAQTTQTATGLCAGTYTYVVSDANGCTASQTVTITGQLTLFVNSQTNVSCYGGSNGAAAITATGGISPYTYLWSSGQTTSTVTGLSAGNYSVTVTDVAGCPTTTTVTITQPTVLSSTAAQTNVCSGASTGIAAVNASGGTAPYTYLWSTGATTVFITGLSAGSYTVTTTDANGCSSTATVITIIPFPAVLSSTSQINVSCFGGSNGSATDSAFGGTPGFTYLWSSGQTTSAISGLSAGNYIATITDTNGCMKTDTIFITQPALLMPNTSQTNVSCNGGSNGSASVSPSGGTPSYSYLWSNAQTTSAISGLSVGNYSVAITDTNGCITTDTILITQPAVLTSITSQTNVSCNGGSNGTATANASGGTSPYSYLWNPSGQTTSSATNLSAGNYFVAITDTNGCTTIDSALLTEPPILSAVASSAPDTCLQANGTAAVSASGGTPAYTFLWNNGQTASTATGLLPGNYSVTVTDANSCTFSTTVTVNYTGTAVANAGADASICFNSFTQLNASGGIIYTWSPVNGLSNPNISNPTASPSVTTTYTVTVTAANGCAAMDSVAVTVNPLPTANAGADATICFSNSTALNANGGNIYLWSPASGLNNANISNPSASPASSITYTVTVTDANGCTDTDDIMVTVNPLAVVSLNFTAVDGCAVPASVTFTASSDIGVTYLWDFGDSTTASGDSVVHIYTTSGTYYASVTVITADGCSTIVVTNPPVNIYPHPLADFTTSPSINPMIIFQNTINFSNQSSGATSYYWDFGDGSASNNTDPQHYYEYIGDYTIALIATNQYGCTDTFLMKTTAEGDIIFPNAFTPNPNGPNGGGYTWYNLDNEVFFPYTAYVEDFHMVIFNRWGELIFETFDIKTGWDGYYRGKLCQQDVYVWKASVKFVDGRILTKAGDVTLLR